MNEEEAKERVERYIKSFNGNALDCIAIGTVLTLLEKKDKIIDEMAKKLSKFDYSQYCEVTNCNYPPCNKEKCIKQYYERKVENGN